MAEADFLFIDPARRDQTGRKTVLIEDCEPNLVDFLSLLLEKAPYTMAKLSPMLDIHRAITSLSAVRPQCVAEVHVVADGGECKELLLVLSREAVATPALYVSESGRISNSLSGKSRPPSQPILLRSPLIFTNRERR